MVILASPDRFPQWDVGAGVTERYDSPRIMTPGFFYV
jgi:hypothetical protein